MAVAPISSSKVLSPQRLSPPPQHPNHHRPFYHPNHPLWCQRLPLPQTTIIIVIVPSLGRTTVPVSANRSRAVHSAKTAKRSNSKQSWTRTGTRVSTRASCYARPACPTAPDAWSTRKTIARTMGNGAMDGGMDMGERRLRMGMRTRESIGLIRGMGGGVMNGMMGECMMGM